jgi:hypothetical protein
VTDFKPFESLFTSLSSLFSRTSSTNQASWKNTDRSGGEWLTLGTGPTSVVDGTRNYSTETDEESGKGLPARAIKVERTVTLV